MFNPIEDPGYALVAFHIAKTILPPVWRKLREWSRRTFIIIVVNRKD